MQGEGNAVAILLISTFMIAKMLFAAYLASVCTWTSAG